MDLAIKKSLLGKYVLIRSEIVKPEFRDLGTLLVLVGGGCFEPESYLSKDYVCTLAANGHIQSWAWDEIDRVATDAEIEESKRYKVIEQE